jgi:hypothetical protein
MLRSRRDRERLVQLGGYVMIDFVRGFATQRGK